MTTTSPDIAAPAVSAVPETGGDARFGKYTVIGRLAQGGMADIYKVKTVGLAGFEKVQVLKRIRPALAREPRFIRSFIDEARIAVSLNHRNIVQVFEFGKVAEELFLAMELIEGVNLRDAVQSLGQRRTTMPVPLICYILGEVAAGLDYAHRKVGPDGRPLGIVHCDVSPQNIALSYEGYVKILDFGVARASFAAELPGKRLRGKPRYMAPEQTRAEPPTPATDVFALGVVAWELLTGLPLFDGPDVESILQSIQRADDVLEASKLNPHVPAALSAAVARALFVDPEQRGSAADLGGAFARAHREMDPGVGSRALALWLADFFPSEMASALPVAETTRPQPAPVLEPDTPPLLEEKRRVVAAACRLDGGTAEGRREARRVLADIAYKQGAVVHAEEQDWLIVLFGLELAGEDDVAHALRFALDAGEALREAPRPLASEDRVTARIGIRQGTVARRRDATYMLLGDTLEEARTLAEAAAPGRTLLGGGAGGLGAGRLTAARFAFREAAPLKRRARRLRVVELLAARAPAESAERTTFHGRDTELAELRAAWEGTTAADERRFFLLVGEAGIGKSRLVAEFAAWAMREGGRLLAFGGAPGGRDTPYATAGDLFQVALGLPAARGALARSRLLERLRRLLEERGISRGDADEMLATVELALELRDGAAPGGESASTNLRDRVVAAISLLRSLLPTARTRLTLVEDIHWADGASVDTLRQIAAGPPAPGAELVLFTARPDENGEPPPFPAGVTVIRLGELGPSERTAMIFARLGEARGGPGGLRPLGGAGEQPAPVDDTSVALIARRAGGNPLFIEELSAGLRDLGPGELPETARGVIVARVDQLPRAAKAVLQYAAVMGPVFRARILEELLGRGVTRALRMLEQSGLVTRASQAPRDAGDEEPEGELAFRRGLIQEVVYEALSGAARREAHRRIGLLCAERHDEGKTESPAAIARHLRLGGEEAQAAVFFLRAGRLALAAFDAKAAVHAFTNALELGAREHPDRCREALSGREQALFHLGEHEAQKRDLDELAALYVEDPRRLGDVLNRTAMRHLRLGEYAPAVAATEGAERAAEDGGDERARGEALRIRAEGFERQADFERALEAANRALEIFRRIGAVTEENRALIGIGRIHLMCSRYEIALTHYGPALERVRNSGDAWLERIICNNLAVVNLNRGEFAEAMQHALRSLEICQRFGDRPREGDNVSIVGTILLVLGRYEESRSWLARGLEIHAQTGSRWSRADALVYAAHRETLAGDAELGFRWLEEAIALAQEIGAKYVVANAKNQLALALIRRRAPGDLARADREASEAAEIGRDAALVACEIQGRARSALARLDAGDPAGALAPSLQAVQLLDRVRSIEWSEEEILYIHYRVLTAVHDGKAHGFLARAYAGLMGKLTRIDDPDWRTAYADAIELHRTIRDEYARASRR